MADSLPRNKHQAEITELPHPADTPLGQDRAVELKQKAPKIRLCKY